MRYTIRNTGLALTLVGFALLFGCNQPANVVTESSLLIKEQKIASPRPDLYPDEYAIFELNVSEELILKFSPRLAAMSDFCKGDASRLATLFADKVNYTPLGTLDLETAIQNQPTDQNRFVAKIPWPLSTVSPVEVKPDQIWQELLAEHQFEDIQFGVVEADRFDDSHAFKMKTIFEGRLLDSKKRACGVKGKQTLIWRPEKDGRWTIHDWQQTELEVIVATRPIFENITDSAIKNVELKEELTRSLHEEFILDRFSNFAKTQLLDVEPEISIFNDWVSSYQYPSISVVDFDNDELEDLFVTDRWGRAVLLRNRGDQTFENATETSGLIVPRYGNCSLFFDFDNDGDADALIGRSLEKSLFWENQNGKFVLNQHQNEVFSDILFVVAGAVVDVNRDGLLDVYLSTYSTEAILEPEWIEQYVRPADRKTMLSHILGKDAYVNRRGPANILLMNRGDRFERAIVGDTVKQWRNSYQSVWTDIDLDGDQDMYLCNDFAPDVFLRNDTMQGAAEPEFTDITNDIFLDDSMAFGMGANFGDYNADGKMDLYVSNMYSKAGLRVIQKLDGNVDPRIQASAKGNFLYQNENGKFRQVAGLSAESQHVAKVGWSFGGQFCDFNNDTKLDLYVPSGFYSAPQPIATQVDM